MRFWWVALAVPCWGAEDYYGVLGLSRRASAEQIRRAYKTLTKKFHPDVNRADPDAAERFSEIAEAYEVLSNPEQRRRYDAYGKEGLQKAGADDDSHFGSIFDLFGFGGGGGSRRPRADKAPDTTLTLYASLAQLYAGDRIQVKYTRNTLCIRAEDCMVNRKDCVGPGAALIRAQPAPGYFVEHQTADPLCVARGKALTDHHCSYCPNGITFPATTTAHGFIEPGMRDGDVIKLAGAGKQVLDLDPGDLYLSIKTEREDGKYRRENDDLHTHLYITLEDALLGFTTQLPHFSEDGFVTVARERTITPDGHDIVLKGYGMPKRGNDLEYGDLHVHVHVRYPVKPLSEHQAGLIHQALDDVRDWSSLLSLQLAKV